MKRILIILLVIFILCFLPACNSHTYEQGYRDGFSDGYESARSSVDTVEITNNKIPDQQLPLVIVENDMYELSLIDSYLSNEKYIDFWSETEKSEQCYVFKFKFYNKYKDSNIRIALVDAAINGYSLCGTSDFHSEDSFSIYAWASNSSNNTAVDCFKLFLSDIESATNIRNAENMGNASLSFVFRAYIVDEMEDYGEDVLYTIDNAFQYCS